MQRVVPVLALMMIVGVALVAADRSSAKEEAKTASSDCLEVGSDVGAFLVTDITGPSAGKSLCYRCKFKDRPVVSIFAREVNDELGELVKQVDSTVAANQDQKMAAFVVLLSDNPEEHGDSLKQLAKDHDIQHTPLTTFEDSVGPEGYKVPSDADVTVMMWVNGKLKVIDTFDAKAIDQQTAKNVAEKTDAILN